MDEGRSIQYDCRMNLEEIANLRLVNQQIARTRFTSPGELVAWMGALQAQDALMVKWAVGVWKQIFSTGPGTGPGRVFPPDHARRAKTDRGGGHSLRRILGKVPSLRFKE
jgi:hypothetical protein